MIRFVTAYVVAGFVVGASLPWLGGRVLDRQPAGGVSNAWMIVTCLIIGVFAASVAFGAASVARKVNQGRSHLIAFVLMAIAFFAASLELRSAYGTEGLLPVFVGAAFLSVATSMLAAGLAERDSKPA